MGKPHTVQKLQKQVSTGRANVDLCNELLKNTTDKDAVTAIKAARKAASASQREAGIALMNHYGSM